jgi:hypothetical protein
MPEVRLSLYSEPASSPIELPSPHVDAVFSNRHAQIFHSQNCSALATTLSTSTEPRPWSSKTSTFTLVGLLSCRLFGRSLGRTAGYGSYARYSWYDGIRGCVRGPDSRILVSVCSNVGDELLSCQGEKSCKRQGGNRRRRKTG